MKLLTGLRARLLAAFLLVALPPLLLLAVAVSVLISRSFEENNARRLAIGMRAARSRVETLRKTLREQAIAVANEDLPAQLPSEDGDFALASVLAEKRALAALEIVDGDRRVISSFQWPVGYGLPDDDDVFPGQQDFRIERVAQGYGSVPRLALTASQPAVWRGAPVTVRSGVFLDDVLRDLSEIMGVEVALRDTIRRRWAPEATGLHAWEDPPLASSPETTGQVTLGPTSYRYVSMALHPALFLVVAMPRTLVDVVTLNVGRVTFAITFGAAAAAALFGFVLSQRIARPVRELAQSARRVAEGDLSGSVEVAASDEVAELAQAFNRMTGELRTSRERLLQAERVAAWREMARRLAHELKNPIFPIQLSIETLRRAQDQDERRFGALFRESSDTILEELRSLKKIIEEFSEFARMPRPQLQPTDLATVIEQVLGLYEARLAGFVLDREIAPDLPRVPADPDLMGRALGNLVANALEAMSPGGTLRVAARACDAGVAVEIADSGPGLTSEQRTRLFTPYFTTKKGGTGLGLAIVQGIVSDHGGRIEVQSEPGQGTTFRLILPVATAPITASPAQNPPID